MVQLSLFPPFPFPPVVVFFYDTPQVEFPSCWKTFYVGPRRSSERGRQSVVLLALRNRGQASPLILSPFGVGILSPSRLATPRVPSRSPPPAPKGRFLSPPLNKTISSVSGLLSEGPLVLAQSGSCLRFEVFKNQPLPSGPVPFFRGEQSLPPSRLGVFFSVRLLGNLHGPQPGAKSRVPARKPPPLSALSIPPLPSPPGVLFGVFFASSPRLLEIPPPLFGCNKGTLRRGLESLQSPLYLAVSLTLSQSWLSQRDDTLFWVSFAHFRLDRLPFSLPPNYGFSFFFHRDGLPSFSCFVFLPDLPVFPRARSPSLADQILLAFSTPFSPPLTPVTPSPNPHVAISATFPTISVRYLSGMLERCSFPPYKIVDAWSFADISSSPGFLALFVLCSSFCRGSWGPWFFDALCQILFPPPF